MITSFPQLSPFRRPRFVAGGAADVEFFTQFPAGSLRNDFAGDAGFKFTPTSNLVVTALGRVNVSGNTQTHAVTLYDATPTALGSVSIDASLGTPGTYEYAPLGSPVSLTSGTPYYLMSVEFNGGDQWYELNILAHTADASLDNAAYRVGATGPINDYVPGNTFVTPNFKYH